MNCFQLRTIGIIVILMVLNAGCRQQSSDTPIPSGEKTTSSEYDKLAAEYIPQNTPTLSAHKELELMAQGIYCYDLPLFDVEWRKRGNTILKSAVYTKTAERFSIPSKEYIEGKYAIVYFPDNPAEGPDFLFLTEKGWVIDRTAVWNFIHYNYSNSGWFAYEDDYPYLAMLKKVFSMRQVTLQKGIKAWEVVPK